LAYNITYKQAVAKDLKRIGKTNARRVMDRIDAELVDNPERFSTLSGPFAGLRKFRVENYRVIFVIMEHDVLILRVQDRKDVYRKK